MAIQHLTLRVPWHDSRWNGRICDVPSGNSFCIALDRIRASRNDVAEDRLAGHRWGELKAEDQPPCIAEAGGFMNEFPWRREVGHPYQGVRSAAETHGHLRRTTIQVPPFSTFATPFWWMLRTNQAQIDQSLAEQLPADERPPFPTPWVFGRARQEALGRLMFAQLEPEHSLVFFYCKEGHPLGDDISRLIVGVGRILTIDQTRYYDSSLPQTYPMWDRLIRHSIRPQSYDGFLLPYHDYLKTTGEPDEDARRRGLLGEVAVAANPLDLRAYSYAAELATPDVALTTLLRCLESVRLVRSHVIASGHWEQHEEWLNEQIANAWKDRGAFPGLGPALEAIGLRLGTALAQEMSATGMIADDADPWPVVDAVLRERLSPPRTAYAPDLRAVRATWEGLSEERRNLLFLLSRFHLTASQALRWFDPAKRSVATRANITDSDILANPYRIAEADHGESNDSPISIGAIDRGLLPDTTIVSRHPLPVQSAVNSPIDERRVRAALVDVLRTAANNGDSLLSVTEALDRMTSIDLARPCEVVSDWVSSNQEKMTGVIETIDVIMDTQVERRIPAVQLTELKRFEERVARVLQARAGSILKSPGVNWRELLIAAIEKSGTRFNPKNERHVAALDEQTDALERITTRKLSVLVGSAGTGKTSALGALLLAKPLATEGVLFLAPTGKARVRLARIAGEEAMTIAQFLNSLGRYDGLRQQPLMSGSQTYRRQKTVVIDESSMLTLDTLMAVLNALDLAHVERIVLVGDPNQLPPIGVGRPFADLVASLEGVVDSKDHALAQRANAVARLTVEVRAASVGASDTLRLASWFTAAQQPVDADRVLGELELRGTFNDLEVSYWTNPDELRQQLLNQFQRHLGLTGIDDVVGFNRALGIGEDRRVPVENTDGVEGFQVLSPVRMHAYGVLDLNRWIQNQFRKDELSKARARPARGPSLGDEGIVHRDKVIQP